VRSGSRDLRRSRPNEVTRQRDAPCSRFFASRSPSGVTAPRGRHRRRLFRAVPESFTEADERRVVSEVAALLRRSFTWARRSAMRRCSSHEPKNYALEPYDGPSSCAGVASIEPGRAVGEAFCDAPFVALLAGDWFGVRERTLRRYRAPAPDDGPRSKSPPS